MRTTLRTTSLVVASIAMVLTLEAGPAGAVPATVAAGHSCNADDCTVPPPVRPCANTSFSRTPELVGIGNKLAAILDELPNAGVARPCIGG